jgi:hypothetical protein
MRRLPINLHEEFGRPLRRRATIAIVMPHGKRRRRKTRRACDEGTRRR